MNRIVPLNRKGTHERQGRVLINRDLPFVFEEIEVNAQDYDAHHRKVTQGLVVALSSDCDELTVGDRVLFGQYAGTNIKIKYRDKSCTCKPEEEMTGEDWEQKRFCPRHGTIKLYKDDDEMMYDVMNENDVIAIIEEIEDEE